jgi:hypothetical protein
MIMNLASVARVVPLTALMLAFISQSAGQALPSVAKTAASKSCLKAPAPDFEKTQGLD